MTPLFIALTSVKLMFYVFSVMSLLHTHSTGSLTFEKRIFISALSSLPCPLFFFFYINCNYLVPFAPHCCFWLRTKVSIILWCDKYTLCFCFVFKFRSWRERRKATVVFIEFFSNDQRVCITRHRPTFTNYICKSFN